MKLTAKWKTRSRTFNIKEKNMTDIVHIMCGEEKKLSKKKRKKIEKRFAKAKKDKKPFVTGHDVCVEVIGIVG